jgi:hypothetical protein
MACYLQSIEEAVIKYKKTNTLAHYFSVLKSAVNINICKCLKIHHEQKGIIYPDFFLLHLFLARSTFFLMVAVYSYTGLGDACGVRS